MSDKRLYGPAYLANTPTNIMQGGGGTAGLYDLASGFTICNTDTAQRTFSIWQGASGASAGGTEIFKDYPIGAKLTLSFPFPGKGRRNDVGEYFVGSADAASKVTITIDGQRCAT